MTPDDSKPRPEYSRVVQLRLTDAQYSALHLEAVEQGVRHTDVLRAAIVLYLHRHQGTEFVSDQELVDALEAAGYSRDEPDLD